MSTSSTAPTELIDLAVSMEDTSQMTDESPGEASSSPKEDDKHPLLQKGVTIANFDNTKGIFTVGQQQWTIHNANKTASIEYIDLHLLRKVCIHLKLKNQNRKSCRNRTECLWGLANPTTFSTDLASIGPTINYLLLANVVVDPAVKPKIMKMYGKGLTKDEQTKKKKTDQDLFTIMLKAYNTKTKYNKMLAKTKTAIPKALMLDQCDTLPEGDWQLLYKSLKKVVKEVEDERCRIEDVSGKNDSDTDNSLDEETTKDESDGLSKKKNKSPYLQYWIKVLENEPNLFTKITASLDKRVFNESENKKIGTSKKAAKCKADDDLVKIFKEDSKVNKKCLALEKKTHDTINHALQNNVISTLNSDRKTHLETRMTLKKEMTTRIPEPKQTQAAACMKKAPPKTVRHHCSNCTVKNKPIFISPTSVCKQKKRSMSNNNKKKKRRSMKQLTMARKRASLAAPMAAPRTMPLLSID
jgi:hypothetical protein